MKQVKLIFIFCFLIILQTKGQDTIDLSNADVLYQLILDDDTLLVSSIEEVHIYSKPQFDNRRDWRKYYKLVRNVKKVYPYAKYAGVQYDTIALHMLSLPTEKERRKYIKEVESEIMSEYEGELKKLTISQGRILLKLIDREIGETSYDLLKDLKGKFSAFFWQTLARIFGHNLKSEFDPDGEDKLLNEIILLIEAGQL